MSRRRSRRGPGWARRPSTAGGGPWRAGAGRVHGRLHRGPATARHRVAARRPAGRAARWVKAVTRTPAGRILAGLVAAIQDDPELATAWRARVLEPLRAEHRVMLRRAIERGEIPASTDTDVALDLMYGAAYRLLQGHRPLTDPFVRRVVDVIVRGIGQRPRQARRASVFVALLRATQPAEHAQPVFRRIRAPAHGRFGSAGPPDPGGSARLLIRGRCQARHGRAGLAGPPWAPARAQGRPFGRGLMGPFRRSRRRPVRCRQRRPCGRAPARRAGRRPGARGGNRLRRRSGTAGSGDHGEQAAAGLGAARAPRRRAAPAGRAAARPRDTSRQRPGAVSGRRRARGRGRSATRAARPAAGR